MVYCLPLPLKFFSGRKPDSVNLGSVLLRVSLACERERKGKKGEDEEELSSSHISNILYPDKKNSTNFPWISKEKLGDVSGYEESWCIHFCDLDYNAS